MLLLLSARVAPVGRGTAIIKENSQLDVEKSQSCAGHLHVVLLGPASSEASACVQYGTKLGITINMPRFQLRGRSKALPKARREESLTNVFFQQYNRLDELIVRQRRNAQRRSRYT